MSDEDFKLIQDKAGTIRDEVASIDRKLSVLRWFVYYAFCRLNHSEWGCCDDDLLDNLGYIHDSASEAFFLLDAIALGGNDLKRYIDEVKRGVHVPS